MIFFDFIGSFVLCHMLRKKKLSLRWNLIPVLPVVAVMLTLLYVKDYAGVINPCEDYRETYVEALDRLASERGVSGKTIYCDSNAGSYAEYLGYRPYIDARAEVYLKKVNGVEDSWHEYVGLQYGAVSCQDFLAEYDFSYLLVNPKVTAGFYLALMRDDAFQVLFQEGDYTVFAPKEPENEG